MRYLTLLCGTLVFLFFNTSQAFAIVLTFDSVPEEYKTFHDYYEKTYSIYFDSLLDVVDHTGSAWGPPHSGSNVMVANTSMSYLYGISFADHKTGLPIYAYSVGGYFSTEPGTILEIYGFGRGPMISATIGAIGESWNNRYVQLDSADGINTILFKAVTSDGLRHFCLDDLTVNFVPEPSSLFAILTGVAGLGGIAWRRRK